MIMELKHLINHLNDQLGEPSEGSETLSIIIPCYNEEGNILQLYTGLSRHLHEMGVTYMLWFIDDGSTDHTLDVIKELAENNIHIKYVSFSRNFGHQKALKAGLDRANGKALIMMDADLQHPISVITALFEKWKEGYEVVNTIRSYHHSWSPIKTITSRLFYKVMNQISDVKITPSSCDFRLLDRKVVLALRQCNEEFLFIRGMVHWCGFRQTAVHYLDSKRNEGDSKYTWTKMCSLATCGLTAFSVRPLEAAIVFALLFMLFSCIEIFYVLYVSFFTEDHVSGWASISILISLLGGIILLMLGIIGEYIGKSFMQGKGRPAYIVRQESEQ